MINRRDILKFTLSLPFMRAMKEAQRLAGPLSPGCPPPTSCQPANVSVLKVLLAGPFAIILQKDITADPPVVQSVTAFTPVDPNHKFLFNGCPPPSLPPSTPTPNYQFVLPQAGLYPNTYPLIDHGCDDFNVETDLMQDPGNHFVSITLPCPEQITFFGTAAHVTFASDGRPGQMPLNHVLQYRVIQPNAGNIVLTNADFNNPCLPQGADTFSFEVGLPVPPPSGVDPKAHARDFFNGKLLPVFPHIQDSEELGFIAASINSTHSAKRLEAFKAAGSPASSGATAVDCTGGGIIVRRP